MAEDLQLEFTVSDKIKAIQTSNSKILKILSQKHCVILCEEFIGDRFSHTGTCSVKTALEPQPGYECPGTKGPAPCTGATASSQWPYSFSLSVWFSSHFCCPHLNVHRADRQSVQPLFSSLTSSTVPKGPGLRVGKEENRNTYQIYKFKVSTKIKQ